MNKAELISAMAEKAGLTKVNAKKALEAFLCTTVCELKKNDGKVTLIGFGTFAKENRPARMGRNPRTGKQIKIAAKNVVKFKASTELNKGIN